jgi:hypothetical protein
MRRSAGRRAVCPSRQAQGYRPRESPRRCPSAAGSQGLFLPHRDSARREPFGVFGAPPAGASPTGFVLMQVTQNLGGGTCQLGSVDLATGVVTPLPHVGADVCGSDLALTPDGRLFGLGSNPGQPAGPIHLFQFDTATGQRAADLGSAPLTRSPVPATPVSRSTCPAPCSSSWSAKTRAAAADRRVFTERA